MTRPQTWFDPLTMTQALNDPAWLSAAFEIPKDGAHVTDMVVSLHRQIPLAGKPVPDASSVADMLAHGERRLLTYNASDFRRHGEHIG